MPLNALTLMANVDSIRRSGNTIYNNDMTLFQQSIILMYVSFIFKRTSFQLNEYLLS